ncbi:MAG TPA: tRNA (adenosine(37)-N6)-threonylcarbamoyltransferase complex ATPase subunit type 1 TsaE [Gammaproteobacteria bacterium]|nr:tRNA (adenosine(37)-N6)-threonylcarbamoyltransferase complex ATPase subunit type 1 TsaE [Gammaproteobacteria bacterium]
MNQFAVHDATAMDALGVRLGRALSAGIVVYLSGELGAGKTTLVRGVLRGLGFTGHVRSPTYTLMEGYEFPGRVLQHLDLYRIRAASELEFLGVRELDGPDRWVFVEWPELGAGALPPPDLELKLELQDPGRRVGLSPRSQQGRKLAEVWRSLVKAAPVPGLAILN